MIRYSLEQRMTWMKWHVKHGSNVEATARHFGITKATFYRWLRRYQTAYPAYSLQAVKPGPRRTKLDMDIVAELSAKYPKYGRGRMFELTRSYGLPFSESTVGRMLKIVKQECPICFRREGKHDIGSHERSVEWHRKYGELEERIEFTRLYDAGHIQPGPPEGN